MWTLCGNWACRASMQSWRCTNTARHISHAPWIVPTIVVSTDRHTIGYGSTVVGINLRQLSLKSTHLTQNWIETKAVKRETAQRKMGCLHYCVKLSVMIDQCIALNLLAVQIVQWKMLRQKVANMCASKRLEKLQRVAPPPVQTGRNIALPLKEMARS